MTEQAALAEAPRDTREDVRAEFGPIWRALAKRYFEHVRFPAESQAELKRLHEQGFVVHVMRTTAWINYLYLTWAMIKRGLPAVRAVVNLRPWFTRPWRKTAQRGEFFVRFTYARRLGGSGLIFLKKSAIGVARGRNIKEDPFPALVAMARKGERNVFLVPELFVWEKWNQRLKPGIIDFLFGSPEAPGFLHTLLAFWRNYRRAQFRMGDPVDLRQFIADNPQDSDEVIARKVRSALHHHLARETRAVFGPPSKPYARTLEETLRDRTLHKVLDEVAAETGRKRDSVQREAVRDLRSISARYSATVVGGGFAPVMGWVFNRIYDGIVVDEAGFERAMKAGGRAPIVLVPSHKSHVDYLLMSYVLWSRGYQIPLIAAGSNLSFWPLGWVLRRGGAFFLRRSFKDDKIYTAVFKAYVKKLVRDGVPQEFFPEGGRSRTGKLLSPKLGLLTWEVEAVLDGARDDLNFVPVSIDYERVVESGTYSKELAGGEKKAEDLSSLLAAPRVLASNYGSIHLSFNEPISLVGFMKGRGLSPSAAISDEQKKNLVRALGNRIMWGISRVSTVTPSALVATPLLAQRHRGITAHEVAERVALLRAIAGEEGVPLSSTLTKDAPSDPVAEGPIHEAMRKFIAGELVHTSEAKGEVIYLPQDERRSELAFYKNTLLNLMAGRSLVACAVLASQGSSTRESVKQHALFLSRLFKFEFIFRVGETFDSIFARTLEQLGRRGLVIIEGENVTEPTDKLQRADLEFIADLIRDYLESYLLAALTMAEVGEKKLDKKEFVKAALETGRSEFLSGGLGAAESLSRTTVETALQWLLDQKYLVEQDKKLAYGPAGQDKAAREALVARIRAVVDRTA
ncbi:MAG: 1-acyl-sn-glycerol-3-phosphate acyltransferase [Myxococcaceae bacterium]